MLETSGGGTCWLSCPRSAGHNPGIFYCPKGFSLPQMGYGSHGGAGCTLKLGVPVLPLLPCHLAPPPYLKMNI